MLASWRSMTKIAGSGSTPTCRGSGTLPYRMSKLQKKPSALKREHPSLQNMKFLDFFLLWWMVSQFFPPGSRSGFWIVIRIHWHDWIQIQFGSGSATLVKMSTSVVPGTGFINIFLGEEICGSCDPFADASIPPGSDREQFSSHTGGVWKRRAGVRARYPGQSAGAGLCAAQRQGLPDTPQVSGGKKSSELMHC